MSCVHWEFARERYSSLQHATSLKVLNCKVSKSDHPSTRFKSGVSFKYYFPFETLIALFVMSGVDYKYWGQWHSYQILKVWTRGVWEIDIKTIMFRGETEFRSVIFPWIASRTGTFVHNIFKCNLSSRRKRSWSFIDSLTLSMNFCIHEAVKCRYTVSITNIIIMVLRFI